MCPCGFYFATQATIIFLCRGGDHHYILGKENRYLYGVCNVTNYRSAFCQSSSVPSLTALPINV